MARLCTKYGTIFNTEVPSVCGQIMSFISVRPALSVLTSHGV